MLFRVANVAAAAVGHSIAAPAAVALISTLCSLVVATHVFGMVVPLDALVLESPRTIVALDGDGVGLFLVGQLIYTLTHRHIHTYTQFTRW